MRNPAIALASALILLATTAAPAQERRVPQPVSPLVKPAPPVAPVVRYFQMTDLTGDLPSETVLKETRQGTRVTSAVIDVCFAPVANSTRRDRFVVTLTPQGNKLVGNGQTQDAKQPVKIDLTRRAGPEGASFEGSITLGTATIEVNSLDNAEQTEFTEPSAQDDSIVERPENFADVSPNALALQVKQDALVAVVRALKSENVRIALDSLVADCSGLRTGTQTLRLKVDPERIPALTTKLKSLSGVTTLGWTTGDYSIPSAVRLPGTPWRNAGKIETEKLSAAVGSALAKTLAATLQATERDAATGEITFKLKRPNQSLPQLELSEQVSIVALFGPEKPGAADAVLAWLSIGTIEIVDDGPEPRLSLEQSRRGDVEGSGGVLDLSVVLTGIARELNGQRWNSEEQAWR